MRPLLSEVACCLGTQECKTVLGGNYTEILWRQTLAQALQNDQNIIWEAVQRDRLVKLSRPIVQSHITFLMHMEEFILTLFALSQKPPPSQNVHKNRVMETCQSEFWDYLWIWPNQCMHVTWLHSFVCYCQIHYRWELPMTPTNSAQAGSSLWSSSQGTLADL